MQAKDWNLEIGKVYGDLEILEFIERKKGCATFKARCLVCGRERNVWIKDVKRGIGNTHSNCVQCIPSGKNNIYVKKLRNIWSHMVDRCTNPKASHYQNYGGRGITCTYSLFIDFYDDFFESFVDHVKQYGFKNTTIDRIDVDGNYEKSNIRWTTWAVQGKNKKWTKYKVTNLQTEEVFIGTAEEISRKIPIKQHYVAEKIRRGNGIYQNWKIEKIEDIPASCLEEKGCGKYPTLSKE